MGRYKWGYKSPNKGYKYSYLTYNSKPMNLQVGASGGWLSWHTADDLLRILLMLLVGVSRTSLDSWLPKGVSGYCKED